MQNPSNNHHGGKTEGDDKDIKGIINDHCCYESESESIGDFSLSLAGQRLVQRLVLPPEQVSRLVSLNLDSCWNIDDRSLSHLLAGMRALVTLVLSRVYCVNDTHLHTVANTCAHLRVLHLQQCWRVTDVGIWSVWIASSLLSLPLLSSLHHFLESLKFKQ